MYGTVDLLKARLQHDTDDDTNDDEYERLLEVASSAIDKYCRRSFALAGTASARVYRPERDHQLVVVDDIGTTSGLLVKTDSDDDGTFETTITNYVAQQSRTDRPITGLIAVDGWPYTRYGRYVIQVTAKWGWPTVPDEVTEAALIYAQRLWNRRSSPGGVMGFADATSIRLARTDPDVASLLDPFRKVAWA